jgi:AcrR family transcriptional regulator
MVTKLEERAGTPRAERKARRPAQERRASIEDAAARLFARDGYESTTVEDIVAAAGVNKPMLYRHFESKQALCMHLMERRRDELAAEPLGSFLEADGPLPERLALMVDAWFAHVEQHPDTSKLLLQDASGSEEIRALQTELRRRQRAADVAMLREFGPPLPEEQLEPLGEIIRSSLTGLALWWLDRANVPRSTVVAAMLRTMRGLLASG